MSRPQPPTKMYIYLAITIIIVVIFGILSIKNAVKKNEPTQKEIAYSQQWQKISDSISKLFTDPDRLKDSLFQSASSTGNQLQNPLKLTADQLDQITDKLQTSASTSTADWLTYTNEEYGFAFKYPAEISLSETENKNQAILFQLSNNSGHFWFYIKDNSKGLSATELKNDYYKNDTYGYQYEDSFLTIAGINSYKQGRYDLENIIENFYIPRNKNTYQFNFEFSLEKKDLINKILSTFKFLETN